MRNEQREFRTTEAEALGTYVYLLWDPRDRKVFYVGKGTGNRVFAHFEEADNARNGVCPMDAKHRRIIEIWEEDLDVNWYIVRRKVTPDVAEHIEAAVIDALEASPNGLLLNKVAGLHTAEHGALSKDEVAALGAEPVNPKAPYPVVFIFPIQNALAEGRSEYDATRSAWAVSPAFRESQNALAIGLKQGVSRIVCQIKRWQQVPSGRWEFVGEILPSHELLNKDWLTVLGAAMGYWQRGNHLVVEFNGKHSFRLLRGSKDKDNWFNLASSDHVTIRSA